MKLSVENVAGLMHECLLDPLQRKADVYISVEGIVQRFGFNKQKIEAHRADIADLLSQLPRYFREGEGDGWSFLKACQNRDGEQWGEQQDAESLMVLGVAAELVTVVPRSCWPHLPGGMPYFVVRKQLTGVDLAKPGTERTVQTVISSREMEIYNLGVEAAKLAKRSGRGIKFKQELQRIVKRARELGVNLDL